MSTNTNSKEKGFPKLLFIFLIPAAGLFGILYVSIKYIPVNKENTLMQEYSYIDKNFNEFFAQQEEFKKSYNFEFSFNKFSQEKIENLRASVYKEYFEHGFKMGENSFKFKVTDKENRAIQAEDLKVLLTRYETNDYNQDIEKIDFKDGYYVVDNFLIDKPGRWKVIVQVKNNGKMGVFEKGIFAK